MGANPSRMKHAFDWTSQIEFVNDTDDTVYFKYGPNLVALGVATGVLAVLAALPTGGSSLAAAGGATATVAGGATGITALSTAEKMKHKEVVTGLESAGYIKLAPGKSWTSDDMTLSLVQQV